MRYIKELNFILITLQLKQVRSPCVCSNKYIEHIKQSKSELIKSVDCKKNYFSFIKRTFFYVSSQWNRALCIDFKPSKYTKHIQYTVFICTITVIWISFQQHIQFHQEKITTFAPSPLLRKYRRHMLAIWFQSV